MVNAAKFSLGHGVMLLAALALTAAAWLRGAEYDEQYTLFLTAGMSRPDWPGTVFPAGLVAAAQAGHATLAGIAQELRATDVHPPLYFWAVSLWRHGFGPGLFAARMMSVLCGLVSLGLVGSIARRCAGRPGVAMLLTLGCYGFVYTNAIARGFAPAQTLTLAGALLLLRGRHVLAGLCLGAACCCNYLAVFAAAAAIFAAGAWPAALAAAPFLAMDAWFFAAQHASRTGQFPPFAIWQSVRRLAEYQVAGVFGGLPLYVDGVGRIVVGAMVGLVFAGLALCIAFARPLRGGAAIRMILAAAVAPPVGLLSLGAVFNNTPIELRYLSFGLPFIAVLVAWALRRDRYFGFIDGGGSKSLRFTSSQRHNERGLGGTKAASIAASWPSFAWTPTTLLGMAQQVVGGRARPDHDSSLSALHSLSPVHDNGFGNHGYDVARTVSAGSFERTVHEVGERAGLPRSATMRSKTSLATTSLFTLALAVQLLSVVGLLFAARTTQPARAAATDAVRLVGDGIVLLPRGNDGVGIVGAFGIEAPRSLPLLLICPSEDLLPRLAAHHRVALATLAQDADSTAAIAAARATLVAANWRLVGIGSNVEAYERTDGGK